MCDLNFTARIEQRMMHTCIMQVDDRLTTIHQVMGDLAKCIMCQVQWGENAKYALNGVQNVLHSVISYFISLT